MQEAIWKIVSPVIGIVLAQFAHAGAFQVHDLVVVNDDQGGPRRVERLERVGDDRVEFFFIGACPRTPNGMSRTTSTGSSHRFTAVSPW